jgi:hypothetical protein
MDEIEQRLRAATDACIASYATWRKDQKESVARAGLLESVHELRKVAARLEIEMAISERNEMAARPIPIPPHRSSRKPHQGGDDFGGPDDNIGNAPDNVGNGPQHGGGGGGGGFNRHNNRGPRRPRPQHGGGHMGGGGGGGEG